LSATTPDRGAHLTASDASAPAERAHRDERSRARSSTDAIVRGARC